MSLLNTKTAIITGASAGIGRAAAERFAREGANLVINARGAERLEALADAIRAEGGQVHVRAVDARRVVAGEGFRAVRGERGREC